MDFQVIVTLGPSIMNEKGLKEIDKTGSCIYRINGAHSDGEGVLKTCEYVRSVLPNATIMLDLPGNKVRTANLDKPIELQKDKTIQIRPDQVNFKEFYKYLKVGDKVLANDSIYTLEVKEIKDGVLTLLSYSTGPLVTNKGLHVQGIHQSIPFFFEKDFELIRAGMEAGINILSLSFVRNADDVQSAKKILRDYPDKDVKIFAKIETLSAVKNLGHILQEVDVINVDRGDLSTDVGLFELASYQERIIDAAKRAGRRVFLATQFLKNMETYPVPLIAEIIDLQKTIKSGIHGIQLSEETAIGKYPVECVETVYKSYFQSFC